MAQVEIWLTAWTRQATRRCLADPPTCDWQQEVGGRLLPNSPPPSSLPAKPVLVFKPVSAHFGDYWHCRSSHFVSGFAGIWHKRKNQKKSKKLKNSKNIRTLPNASELIRTCPNVSGKVRTGPKTSPNLRKLRKTCENFAKTSRTSRPYCPCFPFPPGKKLGPEAAAHLEPVP